MCDRSACPAVSAHGSTDAAFARTLARFNISADALLADAATLTRVLTYHVLPNRVLSTEVPENLTSVATLG